MKFELKYKQFGDCSILVEWPQNINKTILYDILAFKAKLENSNFFTIEGLTHAYASLLITYHRRNFNFSSELKRIKAIYETLEVKNLPKRHLWKIPVCYDLSFGIDLEWLSEEKKMSIDTIIETHSSAIYTVYFIGFLPGFLYLGGLHELLTTPRRASPRLKIKEGAVAVGGAQTGVYPVESPGGWHIIGNSPICFFDVLKEAPCFAKAGDAIQFYPVALNDYKEIKTLVNTNTFKIESEELDD
ncbi:inhibitor of KinA [Jejuia pallidilutea]|uniref:Inhibitor of KinA n=1 Tax=Jejuia pallidilutea TaxID=504487 RepID=A0A362XC74_9FLAO|nr:5-oxoprolinase subunit PxpB [Jejuia pallidilutea]PQV50368.1 inhibitor of KinA [Jejuia pallidilutea]